jgi:hypothetical protein
LSDEIAVEFLEILVSAILESSLGLLLGFVSVSSRNVAPGGRFYTIAKESGTPTSDHTAETLGSTDGVEGLHVALVELRVNLAAAFNEIKRGHCRMSEALEWTVSAI